MAEVKSFRCSGCGAPLDIPQNSKGPVRCTFCHTESVIDGLIKNAEIAAKENINSGFPLSAPPAQLHKILVSLISAQNAMPLDIFQKIEVVKEWRCCVPAYCFYCNGTASFTYESAVERKQTYIENSKSYEKTHIEWMPGSSNASVSPTVFASGNREVAPLVNMLYTTLDPRQLTDIEDLAFPVDVKTYNFDLPQPAAFNEYIVPYIESMLQQKAAQSVTFQHTRNLTLGGSSIQKEVIRVYLGFYCIELHYWGRSFSAWVSGDGKKAYFDHFPADQSYNAALAELQRRYTSTPKSNTLFKTKKGSMLDAQRAQAFHDLESFQRQPILAAEHFKSQRIALRGIYEGLTGDPNAF